jgi:hypothetical protein
MNTNGGLITFNMHSRTYKACIARFSFVMQFVSLLIDKHIHFEDVNIKSVVV